jgi:hypothetical protein
LPDQQSAKAHYHQRNKKSLPFIKKFSKGVFRVRFNISFATSQFLFINLVSFIKASWASIVFTVNGTPCSNKAFILTNQEQQNGFSKRVLRKKDGQH